MDNVEWSNDVRNILLISTLNLHIYFSGFNLNCMLLTLNTELLLIPFQIKIFNWLCISASEVSKNKNHEARRYTKARVWKFWLSSFICSVFRNTRPKPRPRPCGSKICGCQPMCINRLLVTSMYRRYRHMVYHLEACACIHISS